MKTTLSEILEARSVEDAWAALVEALSRHGFERVIYGLTRSRTRASLGNPRDLLVLSNLPDTYVTKFIQNRMYGQTIMARWAASNDGAMSWGLRDKAEDGIEDPPQVTQLNREFGLIAGYTISFPDTSPRQKGAMGIAPRMGISQKDADDLWAQHGEDIMVFSQVAHLKISALPVPVSQQLLSKRQREALEWVGDGKTARDIAEIMGLKAATIEKHLKKAREALEVQTTAQAVMKASLQRQIFLAES